MFDDLDLDTKEILGRAMCVKECPNQSDDFTCKVISVYEGEINPATCRFYDTDSEVYYNSKACKFPF